MDAFKENIEAHKGDAKKMFSQRQLDLIGQSADGTYDGWVVKAETPDGIPATVVLGGESGTKKEPVPATDPNGGLPLTILDPNATPDATPAQTTPTAPAQPVVPVDPAKVETVKKATTPAKPTATDGKDGK
jgi:hypothetical protein